MKKPRVLIYLLLLGAIGLFFLVKSSRSRREKPIPPLGGTTLNLRISCPVYKQADASWGGDLLGPSQSRLSSYGCTISALAMSLSAQGHTIDPKELNKRLSAADGYTENGLLIWDAIDEAIGRNVSTTITNAPTHDAIDRCLQKSIPIITKVYINEAIQHWVLITGKQGKEYLIHDPLGSAGGYESINKYRSSIYRIRIVEIE